MSSTSDQPDSGGGSTAPRRDEADTVDVGRPSVASHERGAALQIGARAARYVVLEEVGRGAPELPSEASGRIAGPIRVLRAYDPKLQREVALKEVRRAALGDEGTKRLVAEARAMAKLSHANVVAVYDVEELEEGKVALVMEFVAGQTLKTWLEDATRQWPEIVDMFRQAGRGLAAAHEAGLLHRDFKPANVLVSGGGNGGAKLPSNAETGRWTAKVTDFGLAKAEGMQSSADHSSLQSIASNDSLTEVGVIMGTPRYMAPEQHRDTPLTPAADQYAFCVSLWEALCGTPPFSSVGDRGQPARSELADAKENGPPPWPKGGVPRSIANAIARGLCPNADDRWPSMDALLVALSRDPLRRRRRHLLVLASAASLLLAGIGVRSAIDGRQERCTGGAGQLQVVWGPVQRTELRAALEAIGAKFSDDVWRQTASALDRYAADWEQMYRDACEATTVRGEQSAAVMDLRMACLQRAKLDLGGAAAVLARADADMAARAHRVVAGLQPLSRCADVEALAADVEPPLPEEAETVERIRRALAETRALLDAGTYTKAKERLDEAEADVSGVAYGPVVAEAALERSWVAVRLGELDVAEAEGIRALELSASSRQDRTLAKAANLLLYIVGSRQQRSAEGLRYRELALGLGKGSPELEAATRGSIAGIYDGQGAYEEAVAEYRRAMRLQEQVYGPNDHRVATTHHNLGQVFMNLGKHDAAEQEYRRAVEIRESTLGPAHPEVANAQRSLGNALHVQGRFEESERLQRRALERLEAAHGPDHPSSTAARFSLGELLLSQGMPAKAEVEFRRGLEAYEKSLESTHPHIATSRNSLGNALRAQGRVDEALVEYRRAIDLREQRLGKDHPWAAGIHINVAAILRNEGRLEEAETEIRAGLSGLEAALGPDHFDVATARVVLTYVLLDRGEHEAALAQAELAWAVKNRPNVPVRDRGELGFLLASALWEAKPDPASRRRALEFVRQAIADLTDSNHPNAQPARDWLRARSD